MNLMMKNRESIRHQQERIPQLKNKLKEIQTIKTSISGFGIGIWTMKISMLTFLRKCKIMKINGITIGKTTSTVDDFYSRVIYLMQSTQITLGCIIGSFI